MPQAADLVVVDYTINDISTAELNSFERLGYEHLVRRLLQLEGRPAVMLLHS